VTRIIAIISVTFISSSKIEPSLYHGSRVLINESTQILTIIADNL